MAGRRDFLADEWATLQRALIASGMLVSLADGVVDPEEMHALNMELRGARFAHRSQLVHELTDVPTLRTDPKSPATYTAYQDGALDTIRAAADIVARKAPAELVDFQGFLIRVAEAVADANVKGDILGVGRQRRTPDEVAAINAITKVLNL